MTTELKQGVEVDFLHGLDTIHHGIINGDPFTLFSDGELTTYVPVWCTTVSDCLIVHGNNITGAREYSVKA